MQSFSFFCTDVLIAVLFYFVLKFSVMHRAIIFEYYRHVTEFSAQKHCLVRFVQVLTLSVEGGSCRSDVRTSWIVPHSLTDYLKAS